MIAVLALGGEVANSNVSKKRMVFFIILFFNFQGLTYDITCRAGVARIPIFKTKQQSLG
jgi:hypothetical protein